MKQCEGWHRRGGAFTLGVPEWKQCESSAVVILLVVQDAKTEVMPACLDCWEEAKDGGIVIHSAEPISAPAST